MQRLVWWCPMCSSSDLYHRAMFASSISQMAAKPDSFNFASILETREAPSTSAGEAFKKIAGVIHWRAYPVH